MMRPARPPPSATWHASPRQAVRSAGRSSCGSEEVVGRYEHGPSQPLRILQLAGKKVLHGGRGTRRAMSPEQAGRPVGRKEDVARPLNLPQQLEPRPDEPLTI